MPDMDDISDSSPSADPSPIRFGDPATQFPFHVRILAVACVLSQLVGPAGFFLLMAAAAVVLFSTRQIDTVVISLAAAGFACPFICMAFRSWFIQWGRRNYPEPESNDDTGS